MELVFKLKYKDWIILFEHECNLPSMKLGASEVAIDGDEMFTLVIVDTLLIIDVALLFEFADVDDDDDVSVCGCDGDTTG